MEFLNHNNENISANFNDIDADYDIQSEFVVEKIIALKILKKLGIDMNNISFKLKGKGCIIIDNLLDGNMQGILEFNADNSKKLTFNADFDGKTFQNIYILDKNNECIKSSEYDFDNDLYKEAEYYPSGKIKSFKRVNLQGEILLNTEFAPNGMIISDTNNSNPAENTNIHEFTDDEILDIIQEQFYSDIDELDFDENSANVKPEINKTQNDKSSKEKPLTSQYIEKSGVINANIENNLKVPVGEKLSVRGTVTGAVLVTKNAEFSIVGDIFGNVGVADKSAKLHSTGSIVGDLKCLGEASLSGNLKGNIFNYGLVNIAGDVLGNVQNNGFANFTGDIKGDITNNGSANFLGDIRGDIFNNGDVHIFSTCYGNISGTGKVNIAGVVNGDIIVPDKNFVIIQSHATHNGKIIENPIEKN